MRSEPNSASSFYVKMPLWLTIMFAVLCIAACCAWGISIGRVKINPFNPLSPIEYKGMSPSEAILSSQGVPTPKSLQAVGEKLNQQLDETLQARQKSLMTDIDQRTQVFIKSLDDQKLSFLSGLDDIAQDSILVLDTTLASAIEKTNESLERQNGVLDITLSKQRAMFESSMLGLILAFTATAIFMAFAIYLARKLIAREKIKKQQWGIVSVAAALTMLTILSRNEIVGKPSILRQMEADIGKQYAASIESSSLKEAAFYATQLYSLDRTNSQYRFKLLKSQLLRDVFERPTIYKTESGIRDLDRRLREIEQLQAEAELGNDADLIAIQALVRWQIGDSRIDEAIAASLAVDSLNATGEIPSLKQLMKGYLLAYLAFPIADDEMDFLSIRNSYSGVNWKSISEVETALQADKSTDKEGLFDEYYEYSRLLSETYRTSVPLYIETVYYNSLSAREIDPSKRTNFLERRNIAAKSVVANWSQVGKELKNERFENTSVRIASLRSIFAISTRARQYLDLGDKTEVPEAIASMPETIFLDEALESARPGMRRYSYGYIKLAATTRFIDQLNAMKQFETGFDELLKARTDAEAGGWNATQTAELSVKAESLTKLSSRLGLFYCSSSQKSFDNTKMVEANVGFGCQATTGFADTQQLSRFAYRLLLSKRAPTLSGWSEFLSPALSGRIVPAL